MEFSLSIFFLFLCFLISTPSAARPRSSPLFFLFLLLFFFFSAATSHNQNNDLFSDIFFQYGNNCFKFSLLAHIHTSSPPPPLPPLPHTAHPHPPPPPKKKKKKKSLPPPRSHSTLFSTIPWSVFIPGHARVGPETRQGPDTMLHVS